MSLQLDIPCDDDTAITTKRAQGPRLQAMPSHYSLNRDPSTPLPLLQSDTDLCSNLLDAILENEYVHYLVIKTLHCSFPFCLTSHSVDSQHVFRIRFLSLTILITLTTM